MNKEGKRSFNGRYIFFLFIVIAMFGYLTYGLVDLQILSGDEYSQDAQSSRTKTIYLRGSRGMITDADSVIMAQSENIYNVTFYKDISQNSKPAYVGFTTAINETIDIVEDNGGSISLSYVIERNLETGEWQFNFGSGVSQSVLDTREKQWRSNNYATVLKCPTAADCIIMLQKQYQIPADMTEERMLQVMSVYSEMQMNAFNSQPIVISKDVTYETVIEIESQSMVLSGMEIEVGTKRVYPRSTLAAQIIGYTGAISSNEQYQNTLKAKGYSYNDTIGKDGIEASMEDWLTENSSLRKGTRVVERDSKSRITREISSTEPQDGNNVKLTLIASYQQAAERAIANTVNDIRDIQESRLNIHKWQEENKDYILDRNWELYPLQLAEHGCMIVLNMQGEVLAMANYPTYDLNALVSGGDAAMEILTDERGLLMNYGIHARGTPGSIFKMVAGLGAMLEGKLGITEKISDGGYYTEYNKDLSTAPKCWINLRSISSHADQTIVEGLSHSCNYFFYTLGDRLGEDRLYRYAALLGLTSKTGIDLPGELRSVVGTQNTLYDPTKPVQEAYQDTSLPIITFNAIKKHLRNCGASRNIEYDDERLSRCVKRLMDMAVNTGQDLEWMDNIRTILMEELNMPQEMVNLQAVAGDVYNYLNNIKWGGGQTILTAVGQSVTFLTPAAVARYVCAIANGGTVYNLMLVDSISSPEGDILSQRTPTISNVIDGAEQYLPYIRAGMAGVVDDGGTAARHFKSWKYDVQTVLAAKTGTAQVSQLDVENNSWFVAFAPQDNPEIAVVVFVPNGYSGSESAPAARDFISWYLDQKTLRTQDVTLPIGNTLAP